jgi:hypothetical protein
MKTVMMLMMLMATAMGFAGCGTTDSCGGTETGNPAACPSGTGQDDTDDGDASTEDGDDTEPTTAFTVTDQLLSGLCSAMDVCYDSFVDADCVDFISTDANTIAAFGINSAVIDSFEQVQDLIDAGSVNVDNDVLTTCLDDIAAVSCSAMDALAIFSESNPRYTQVYRIVQPECDDIFSSE